MPIWANNAADIIKTRSTNNRNRTAEIFCIGPSTPHPYALPAATCRLRIARIEGQRYLTLNDQLCCETAVPGCSSLENRGLRRHPDDCFTVLRCRDEMTRRDRRGNRW